MFTKGDLRRRAFQSLLVEKMYQSVGGYSINTLRQAGRLMRHFHGFGL
jgi:hypothetical protein